MLFDASKAPKVKKEKTRTSHSFSRRNRYWRYFRSPAKVEEAVAAAPAVEEAAPVVEEAAVVAPVEAEAVKEVEAVVPEASTSEVKFDAAVSLSAIISRGLYWRLE
jgi:uncharacterized caspase-like protein